MEGVSFQEAFNLAVALLAALFGWIMNSAWGMIKDTQKDNQDLANKVAAVEILVVGKFVPRREFTVHMSKIEASLQRIEDKLDGKADK